VGVAERVEVRLLGPPDVLVDDAVITLGARKERMVLVVLALSAGRAVSEGRLVDALWGEESPPSATKTLRVYVSRLRRALVDSALEIESGPAGYVLRGAAVDVSTAEQLAAEARRAAGAGDAVAAAAGFAAALSLWRGPSLGDVAGEPAVRGEAARLDELRTSLAEGRVEAELALGHHDEVISELESLCATWPLREHLWALRMTALYRAGRQAEALRAYQQLRANLAEELGIEPSPELRQLEQAVLEQRAELSAPPSTSSPTTTPQMAPAPLPTGVVTFLLTDIVGSSELWEAMPKEMGDALALHDQVVSLEVAASAGAVLKARGEGDSTFSVFTRASDAAAAALAVQAALAVAAWPDGIALSVRMALHTGEAVERDGDYYGPAVNRAARLRGLASGGQILVSAATAQLLQDRLPQDAFLVDLGSQRLRGLSRAEPVFALTPSPSVGATSAATQGVAIPLSTSPGLPRRLEDATGLTMVGRAAELEVLAERWRAACQGAPGLVSVVGEAGIGKTRLVAALAELVVEDAATVLFGECEQDPELVYQPWAAALGRDMRGRDPTEMRRLLGDSGELARLVPELHVRLPELPPPFGGDPAGQKARLFAAVVRYLAALGAERPVLVILEDLHWADQPTVDLLRHVVRTLERDPVLIVVTFRDTEPDEALGDLLAELARRHSQVPLRLEGLALNEVEQMARSRLGLDAIPDGLARALRDHTDGNAFFLEEVLRDLALRGDAGPASVAGVPASVQAAVSRSLAQLGPDSSELLAAGAVIGRRFDLELLASVTGEEEDVVLKQLAESARRGLVRETLNPAGGFAFAHALVREVLLGEIGPTRRARLHLRVGEALEQRSSTAGDQPSAELAFHFLAAKNPRVAARAAAHAEAAGMSALARLGYTQAAEFFTQALEALETVSHPDLSAQGRLLVLRGKALTRIGRMLDGRASFVAAVEVARQLGDGVLAAEAARGIGSGYMNPASAEPELVKALELSVALVGRASGGLHSHVAGWLAAEQRHAVPWPERDASSALALDEARSGADARTKTEALMARHLVLLGVPGAPARLSLADELIAHGQTTGDREAQLQGLIRQHSDLKEIGDAEGAERSLAAYQTLANDIGQPFFLYSAALTRASFTMSVGSVGEAERQLGVAVELLAALEPLPVVMETLQAVVGFFLMLTGRYEAALAATGQMLDHQEQEFSPAWRVAYPWVLAEAGRIDEAGKRFEEVADQGYIPIGESLAPVSLGICAKIAYRVGAAAHSRELRARLSPFADGWIQVHWGAPHLGPVPLFLGLLAALEGRTHDSDELLGRAGAMAARFGSRRFEAEALCYRAEIHRRYGNNASAVQHLAAAERLVAGTGWESLVDRFRSAGEG
jgi:DNA-binding SARP family transcriptional activator